MRAIAIALCLGLAPMAVAPLAGCASVNSEIGSRQALYTAALAYEGALDTVTDLAKSGVIKGDNAVKTKAILDKANTALQAARTSQSASGARRVLIILAELEGYTNGR